MRHRKPLNVKEEKLYSCSMCGKSYKGKDRKFTPSLCSLYKANDGLMTICRDCVSSIYNSYLKKFNGDEYNAIKRVCMLLNIYFCDALFEHSANTKMFTNRMSSYLSKINLLPYMHKTFDDYLFSQDYKEPEIKEEKPDTIPERLVKVWGFGFTLEEYQFLNNKFSEWKSKVVIDGIARESLVRDLCIIKLQQQKSLRDGEIDLYNRLQKTYQDTLSSANLKPIQTENADKAMEKPLGLMIEMFENEEPIPEPSPEWKDVDNIQKLFNIYFLGHLCKMLNIKNRYSQMYEDEMQKYRVNIEEIQDLPDEDVFEYLSENGFAERTDKDGS